jgi:hypothetical protein
MRDDMVIETEDEFDDARDRGIAASIPWIALFVAVLAFNIAALAGYFR